MTVVVGESHHKDMMKKKEKGEVILPFNTLGLLFLEMLVGNFKLENFSLDKPCLGESIEILCSLYLGGGISSNRSLKSLIPSTISLHSLAATSLLPGSCRSITVLFPLKLIVFEHSKR